MISAQLVKKDNQLETLVKNLIKIDDEKLEVGHFEEQGAHSSGVSYTALMRKHHAGYQWERENSVVDVPSRPVLSILQFKLRNLKNTAVRRKINKWFKSRFTLTDHNDLLNGLGETIVRIQKRIFGDNELLEDNAPITIMQKGSNTPLVETGELKSKTAYKSSLTSIVKEVS